jgi:hypothetical protein
LFGEVVAKRERAMIDVPAITDLHENTVVRWHQQGIDNQWDGLLGVVCTQHSLNFQLWHQEDIARSPDADDSQIAGVKRAIDRLNQQRNDWIEKIDDWISQQLRASGIFASEDAPMNTETPGSAIDRLSVLALRIYHYREQAERPHVAPLHVEAVRERLAICLSQQVDLSRSLAELASDIAAGRKRHKTYRQLKMYNDPTLNPYLYQSRRKRADAME